MPVTRNTKYLDLKNAVSPWDVGSSKPTYDPCFLFLTGFSYTFLPLFEIIQGIPWEWNKTSSLEACDIAARESALLSLIYSRF